MIDSTSAGERPFTQCLRFRKS